MQVLNRVQLLTYFSWRPHRPVEESHRTKPPALSSDRCQLYLSLEVPQPKAKDSLHVLHGDGHLTAR